MKQNNLVKKILKPVALGITTAILAINPSISNAQTQNELLNSTNDSLKEVQKNPADTCGDFIYVPSIDEKVAKELAPYYGRTFKASHKFLHDKKNRMITLLEFEEFLKYTKINFPDIYNGIIKPDENQAEYLDAKFKFRDNELYINSEHYFKDGKLVPRKTEILDTNTLIQDKQINLKDLLNNSTKQGLPNKKIESGDFNYQAPMIYNNLIIGYDVEQKKFFLNCRAFPMMQTFLLEYEL